MKQWPFFAMNIGLLIGSLALARPAMAAPLDELITAAKKEGIVDLYAPA